MSLKPEIFAEKSENRSVRLDFWTFFSYLCKLNFGPYPETYCEKRNK